MKTLKLAAKTFHGLEEVLAKEIEALGGQNIEIGLRCVTYEGDLQLMYKSNYLLRTALSVLWNLHHFEVDDIDKLYKEVYSLPWDQYFKLNQTFSIKSVVNSRLFTHSHFVALKVKDAIVDRFRKVHGERPSVDTDEPDIVIDVHIGGNQCTISLDSSGEPLFKRGYRIAAPQAPINEVLAAGIIDITGWDSSRPFLDTMCGSGTFLIEAAMKSLKIPAGVYRDEYSFQNWTNYEPELYESIVEAAMPNITDNPIIIGSDISPVSIRQTETNIREARLTKRIKTIVKPFDEIIPPEDHGVLVINPPYGERLQPDDAAIFYKNIGDTLKKNFQGYQAWIITSYPDAIKQIGLHTSARIPLFNGSLECKLLNYKMYKGSKKDMYAVQENDL